MKRMLFNATHPEETRVGIVDGQKLIDIDIETAGREARKSNIYMGVVTRVEPSLEACFIDYGEDRHGFLPFKEISRAYFAPGVDVRMATIKEAIKEGQELIVQVEKEERGNKGAALTTFISLAGRYLVLMPNNPRAGGVSRRIEGEERQELREAMDKLDLPRGMSTIARTAGIGRTTEELQWDLNYLLKLWEAISDAARPQYEYVVEENGRKTRRYSTEASQNGRSGRRVNPAPFLIVEESNLVVRAIRDYFQPEIGEILVDTDEIYEQARQFMAHVMPDMVDRVKRYRDDIPLFTRFQIEQQIETAYSRTVPLPSGGAIVIDHTEALVAIDVNSARATRGADIEDTAFRTNCEAADEVARQMRLRDLGGLIVIDFIDMAEPKNQRAVEQRLKDAIRCDRARVQIAKISRFGLMELSRQRLRPSLSEGSHVTCPRCNGVGVIRDTESCAIQVLRILQEEAMKDGTGCVQAQVPVDVATFLLNEKRNDITKLEARHRVPIMLIPNTSLETPHYHIERMRQDDERLESTVPSFNRVEEIETKADDPYAQKSQEDKPVRPKQVPVIKNIIEREPAPVHQPVQAPAAPAAEERKAAAPRVESSRTRQLTPVTPERSIFRRIIDFLFGSSEKKAEPAKTVAAAPAQAAEKPAERTERSEERRRGRGSRGERSERGEHGERGERRTRGGRGRAERADRSERGERSERADRPERTERGEKLEGRARRSRTGEERRRSRRAEETEGRVAEDAAQQMNAAMEVAEIEPVQAVEAAQAVQVAEAAESQVREVRAPEAEGADEERRSRRRRSRRRPAEDSAEGVKEEAPLTQVETAPAAEATEVAAAPAETAPEAASAAEASQVEQAAEGADAAEASEDEGARRRRPRRRRRGGRGAEEGAAAELAETAESSEGVDAAQAAAEAALEPAWKPAEEPLVQIETKSAVSQAVEGVFAVAEESAAKLERRRSRRGRKPRQEAAETQGQAPAAADVAAVAEAAQAVEVKAEAPAQEPELFQVETAAAAAPETAPTVEPAPVVAETAPEAQAEEAPAEEAEEAEAAVEPAAESIDAGLEDNLRSAGLVQVHTAQPSAATGYEPVKQPGRVIEHAAAEEDEGPLVQVQTRSELCAPVSYAPVVQPGRKVESHASEAGSEPLVQVETKRA